jgi:hypothetical protein
VLDALAAQVARMGGNFSSIAALDQTVRNVAQRLVPA